MINERNKVLLDEINPENPFPSSRIDMRLEEIYCLIMKVTSSQLSPEKLVELGNKIERMGREMKDIVNDWKKEV